MCFWRRKVQLKTECNLHLYKTANINIVSHLGVFFPGSGGILFLLFKKKEKKISLTIVCRERKRYEEVGW